MKEACFTYEELQALAEFLNTLPNLPDTPEFRSIAAKIEPVISGPKSDV